MKYEIDRADLRECRHFAPTNFHGADESRRNQMHVYE